MNLSIVERFLNITLDFSQVERAYPNGMVPLIAQIAKLKDEGIQFNVIPPQGDHLQSVFQRNGWLHYLDPKKWDPSPVIFASLLPLVHFRTDEELNDAVDQAVQVCMRQLGLGKYVPHAFEWALKEIAGNVLVHSEADGGWIQVVTSSQ